MSDFLRKITTESLPPGDLGTFYTLSHMAGFVRRDAADPELRSYAEQVVAGTQPHDFEAEVKSVFNYVRGLPYRKHPVDLQKVIDARSAIAATYLDCVSKSVLLATLLGSLGHISRFAVVRQTGGEFDHVYVETLVGGKWTALDPTPDQNSGGYADVGYEVAATEKRAYPIWPGTIGGSLLGQVGFQSAGFGRGNPLIDSGEFASYDTEMNCPGGSRNSAFNPCYEADPFVSMPPPGFQFDPNGPGGEGFKPSSPIPSSVITMATFATPSGVQARAGLLTPSPSTQQQVLSSPTNSSVAGASSSISPLLIGVIILGVVLVAMR